MILFFITLLASDAYLSHAYRGVVAVMGPQSNRADRPKEKPRL